MRHTLYMQNIEVLRHIFVQIYVVIKKVKVGQEVITTPTNICWCCMSNLVT